MRKQKTDNNIIFKVTLLLLFALSSNINSIAQVYIGFEGGMVGSTMSDTKEEQPYYTPHKSSVYGFKLQANFKTNPNFSFQTGINFSKRGADYYRDDSYTYQQSGWNGGEDYYYDIFEQTWSAQYLHIPATIKFTVFKNPCIYFLGGVYFAQLLSGEGSSFDTLNITHSDRTSSRTEYHRDSYDLTEVFNKTDFGLIGGFGIQVAIKQKVLLFTDFTVQYGLVNIPKGLENVENMALVWNFGVMINIAKSAPPDL